MLEGFRIYNMSIGTASVSINENGMSFSKSTVIKMDKVKYVKLYIDDVGKRIAIQKSDKRDESSISFYNEQKTISVRWNNKELLKTVAKMMDWNLHEYIYKIDGDYFSEDEVMIFDLNTAEAIPSTSKN